MGRRRRTLEPGKDGQLERVSKYRLLSRAGRDERRLLRAHRGESEVRQRERRPGGRSWANDDGASSRTPQESVDSIEDTAERLQRQLGWRERHKPLARPPSSSSPSSLLDSKPRRRRLRRSFHLFSSSSSR